MNRQLCESQKYRRAIGQCTQIPRKGLQNSPIFPNLNQYTRRNGGLTEIVGVEEVHDGKGLVRLCTLLPLPAPPIPSSTLIFASKQIFQGPRQRSKTPRRRQTRQRKIRCDRAMKRAH